MEIKRKVRPRPPCGCDVQMCTFLPVSIAQNFANSESVPQKFPQEGEAKEQQPPTEDFQSPPEENEEEEEEGGDGDDSSSGGGGSDSESEGETEAKEAGDDE